MQNCLDGECYDCHDKVFFELKSKTDHAMIKYNSTSYDQKDERRQILGGILGAIGTYVWEPVRSGL